MSHETQHREDCKSSYHTGTAVQQAQPQSVSAVYRACVIGNPFAWSRAAHWHVLTYSSCCCSCCSCLEPSASPHPRCTRRRLELRRPSTPVPTAKQWARLSVYTVTLSSYLRVCESGGLGQEIVDHPLNGTRKREAADQKNDQHHIREGSSKINHLGAEPHMWRPSL